MTEINKVILELAKKGFTPPEIAQTLNYPEQVVLQVVNSPFAKKVLGDDN